MYFSPKSKPLSKIIMSHNPSLFAKYIIWYSGFKGLNHIPTRKEMQHFGISAKSKINILSFPVAFINVIKVSIDFGPQFLFFYI